jgi:hypothetical protein
MAACVAEDVLYAIGRGRLHVFGISNPASPKIMGSLDGLGNTRQIAVDAGIAYITSREHGVFIIDVKNPRHPEMLAHYDPIEVATGVAISGDVLLVACRSFGLELVDVRNPHEPSHLSTVRTGESQSVAAKNGYAYVGVWGTSQLVVVDIRNPHEPTITAKRSLDGYGDGVTVCKNLVLVATGHHSRARTKRWPREGDPGFGCGHGMEIFEISNPAEPAFVSRIKSPPFYRIGMDMWGVQVAGNHAFLADTYNGLFVVDIKDPAKPSFVAYRQLPYVNHYGLPSPVGGFALTNDYIYVAGAWTDLHVMEAEGLARPVEKEPDQSPTIGEQVSRTHERFHIYQPGGQVRDVGFLDDTAILAAGSGGIHLVQISPEIRHLSQFDTDGFAMDVEVQGDQVYVAEDKGGLSIWQRAGHDNLEALGRYRPARGSVRSVVIPPLGRYALLQVDLSILEIVDVTNPATTRRVSRDSGHGFLYHVGDDVIDDRCVCVLWQLSGLRWYDLYGRNGPTFSGDQYPHRLGSDGTVAAGSDRLVITRGGLVQIGPNERRPPEELGIQRVGGQRLSGKPRRYGDRLYLADSRTGDVTILDISNSERPGLIERMNLPGNPSSVVRHQGVMVIPNGYEGLWVEKIPSNGTKP